MQDSCSSCGKEGRKIGTIVTYLVSDFVEKIEKITDIMLEGGGLMSKVYDGKFGFKVTKSDKKDVSICQDCTNAIIKDYRTTGLIMLVICVIFSALAALGFLKIISMGLIVKIILSCIAGFLLIIGLFSSITRIDDKMLTSDIIVRNQTKYIPASGLSEILKRAHNSLTAGYYPKRDKLYGNFKVLAEEGSCYLFTVEDKFDFKSLKDLDQFREIEGMDQIDIEEDGCSVSNIIFKYEEKY